jgi:hypothetical protein
MPPPSTAPAALQAGPAPGTRGALGPSIRRGLGRGLAASIRRTPSQWELVGDLDNTPDAGATSSPANSAGETAVPASRGQTRARGRARAPRGRPIVRAEADAPPRGRGGRGRGGRRAARGGSSRGANTQAGEGVISQQNGQGDGQATGGTATEGGFDPFHNTF